MGQLVVSSTERVWCHCNSKRVKVYRCGLYAYNQLWLYTMGKRLVFSVGGNYFTPLWLKPTVLQIFWEKITVEIYHHYGYNVNICTGPSAAVYWGLVPLSLTDPLELGTEVGLSTNRWHCCWGGGLCSFPCCQYKWEAKSIKWNWLEKVSGVCLCYGSSLKRSGSACARAASSVWMSVFDRWGANRVIVVCVLVSRVLQIRRRIRVVM